MLNVYIMLLKLISVIFVLTNTLFSLFLVAKEEPRMSTVVSSDEVNWGYLNPLRGDKSPGAAELWGDRTKNVATGMLVKFKKGFSSPPHVHNITYRGIVIKGMMHNADPSAEKMWMPTGSYWTQPAGDNHITAANSEENLIFLEIENGPYLVKPSTEHFDNGEVPINLHESNLVWLDSTDLKKLHDEGVQITALWANKNNAALTGSMIELPKGFKGTITANASEFRAVVIQGEVAYQSSETTGLRTLPVASYFNSVGKFQHHVSAEKDNVMLYIRNNSDYQITAKQQ